MSERRPGHEQFRNLFKAPSKEQQQQTSVKIAVGTAAQSSRSKNSTSPFSKAGSKRKAKQAGVYSKSAKSVKKKSGHTPNKSSGSGAANRRVPSTNTQQSPASNKPEPSANNSSHRRGGKSKSPHRAARTPIATTPTTPPVPSRPRTPKKPSTAKWNGEEVPATSQMCRTVFENDGGGTKGDGMTTTGGPATEGGGGHIQLAEAKIKERKLQWKKEEKEKEGGKKEKESPKKQHDPRVPEISGGSSEKVDKEDKKGAVAEAANNKTITIFENDDQQVAEVKEEAYKLQWVAGALPDAKECTSEPAVRKKQTRDEKPRGAQSDRPHSDQPPVKPPRHVFTMAKVGVPPRTPVRTPKERGSPVAVTPPGAYSTPALSPGTKPMMLEPSSNTNPASITGSVGRDPVEDAAEKMVSVYVMPTLQHADFNSAELVKKDEKH